MVFRFLTYIYIWANSSVATALPGAMVTVHSWASASTTLTGSHSRVCSWASASTTLTGSHSRVHSWASASTTLTGTRSRVRNWASASTTLTGTHSRVHSTWSVRVTDWQRQTKWHIYSDTQRNTNLTWQGVQVCPENVWVGSDVYVDKERGF